MKKINLKEKWGVVMTLMAAISNLTFTSCDSFGSKDEYRVEYLAVQIDENDSWSIIDTEGKVVVDREYAAEDKVSNVYDDGIYWVKSNNKYRLYSVDSPKKSISDGEYDNVTDFNEGKAFVSITGQPIIMINSEGKQIKTLDKDVARVYPFNEGLAVYYSQNGKQGYLNKYGEVAIPAKYEEASHFNDGVAEVVLNADKKRISLIDKNGKEKMSLDKSKYNICSHSEGKLGVTVDPESDNPSVAYLDYDGKEVISKIKDYKYTSNFKKGYCIIYNFMNDDYAVINEKGEKVIRGGKYKSIYNIGNATFVVKKGDKYGVVDAEDNTLVKFDYDDFHFYRLGDNYIMKSGNYYTLITPKGEEIKKSEFRTLSAFYLGSVDYVDVQAYVDKFTEDVSTKGVKSFDGHRDVATITKKLELTLDSCNTYDDNIVVTTTFNSGKITIKRDFWFTQYLKTEKFHEEKVNDGWFESTRYVSDGYHWNPDSKLRNMTITINLDNVYHKTFMSMLDKNLTSKGFKKHKDDGYYYAGKGDNEKRVYINDLEYNGEITLKFMLDGNYY